jgi:hypothetical protein
LDVGSTRLCATTTTDITKVTGLTGLPGVRGATYDRPEADGAVEPANQYLAARVITIDGEVWGASVDAAWTSWNTVQAVLLGAVQTPILLKFRRAGGTLDLQCTVRTASNADTDLSADLYGPFLRYHVAFRAADPYLYSQVSQSVTAAAPSAGAGMPLPIIFPIPFGSATGGTVAATNAGNAAAWPVLTIAGPIVNFDGLSLAAGDSLVITTNPGARSATVAGVSVLSSIRFVDSVWPYMTPGVSQTWQFYAGGGGTTGSTTLTVSWADTYIS